MPVFPLRCAPPVPSGATADTARVPVLHRGGRASPSQDALENRFVIGLPLSQIMAVADRLFPFEAAEPWDNCGIQIGDPRRMVLSIAFSLDATPQTVEFAADLGCELLVTHHPVILDPVRRIVPDDLPGSTLFAAARLGVDVLSLHTNLDAAAGGLNDHLAVALGLDDVTIPVNASCARLGLLAEAVSLFGFADRVSKSLALGRLRVVAAGDRQVRKVFCASGSGMGYLNKAVACGADVMVTGDLRYHAAREALQRGMPVIDAGHYGLEKAAPRVMAGAFQREFSAMGVDIPCHPCDQEKEPFFYIDER